MNFFQSEIQIILFLEKEWDDIIHQFYEETGCYGLKRPVFSINPEMSCWGRWRGGTYQTLELSSRLVWEHPWYSVCEVLRHETAHQLQEFLYPHIVESSHGPYFRKCCMMLRANPAASGNYPLTDQVVFAPENGGDDSSQTLQQKITVRIHKLLALSQSSDPHEAESALLKARELMQKYQVESLEDQKEEDGFYYITLGSPAQRTAYTEHQIANILNSYYNVRAIWQFVPGEERYSRHRRILAIYGKAADLRIASYVYDSLHVVIDRYWDLHRKALKEHRSLHAKSDFTYGLLCGFEEALAKQPVPPKTAELMRVQSRALDDFFHWQNPHIRHASGQGRRINPAIRDAGQQIGRNLTLPGGLENRTGNSTVRYLN